MKIGYSTASRVNSQTRQTIRKAFQPRYQKTSILDKYQHSIAIGGGNFLTLFKQTMKNVSIQLWFKLFQF